MFVTLTFDGQLVTQLDTWPAGRIIKVTAIIIVILYSCLNVVMVNEQQIRFVMTKDNMSSGIV